VEVDFPVRPNSSLNDFREMEVPIKADCAKVTKRDDEFRFSSFAMSESRSRRDSHRIRS
jgi:hypothetical protein